MKKSKDLRIIKTDENIRNTFLSILKEKSFEEITVKELCEKARISRNTFYHHYHYKHNLYNSIIKDSVDTIVSGFKPLVENVEDINEEIFYKYINNFIDKFHNEKEVLNIILSQDKSLFTLKLSYAFFDSIMDNASLISKNTDSHVYRLYVKYISSGLVGFVIDWLHKESCSKEEAKEILYTVNLGPMKVASNFLKKSRPNN